MNDELQTWTEKWKNTIGAIRRMVDTFNESPPPCGTPDERLAAILEIWGVLDVSGLHLDPAKTAATAWADKIASRNRHDDIFDALSYALLRMDSAAGDAVQAGGKHPSVIATADFGPGGHRIFSAGTQPDGSHVSLVAGVLSRLPADHPARNLLSADDCFQYASAEPSLVLGPAYRNDMPRRWYLIGEVVMLTRQHRARQRREEEEKAERERHEAERERRRIEESPAVRQYRQMKNLEELDKRGLLPEVTPVLPAVRGAGPIASFPNLH